MGFRNLFQNFFKDCLTQEENEKTEIKKNSDIFKIMDKDKILKRKIIGAINNYKDEEPVQKLKILSVILFFIMFGFGFRIVTPLIFI